MCCIEINEATNTPPKIAMTAPFTDFFKIKGAYVRRMNRVIVPLPTVGADVGSAIRERSLMQGKQSTRLDFWKEDDE